MLTSSAKGVYIYILLRKYYSDWMYVHNSAIADRKGEVLGAQLALK
jgi:hypothetical protein